MILPCTLKLINLNKIIGVNPKKEMIGKITQIIKILNKIWSMMIDLIKNKNIT